MKRKGRYTYVPKDEIAEVRTFNDVSFETDDLLDGAYVKGRKKYARGGMPSKRPISLEEQAAESVGYDTWYMMDAVDQKELVDELVSTGMIAPMFGLGGMMADGGKDDTYVNRCSKNLKPLKPRFLMTPKVYKRQLLDKLGIIDYSKQTSDDFKLGEIVWDVSNKRYGTVIGIYDQYASDKYEVRLDSDGMQPTEDLRKVGSEGDKGKKQQLDDAINSYERLIKSYPKNNYPKQIAPKMAKGGMMAEGGELTEKQSAIDEALKIAQFAYENDITASGNSIEEFSNKIFDLSGISYAKAYLGLAYQAMKNQGYADGGVTGSTYVVKYSMKDTPEIVKEKIFTDKDSAELFHETISDDEDLVVMDLQEIKAAPAPAPKKSLFTTAKPAPATTAAAKKKRERVQVDGIADEIARYDALKATINNAKAEQEVIGGRLKEIGREKFLDLYEQRGVRPANFDLADGSENILLEVTDKYLKVEPEKAELLRQFGGLLEEKTTYEFDSEILEKEVSDGMTIGDVVSMLIQDSKLIPDSDKANLIKAKMSMRVPKGTLDRLMDYDNPREVFSLISPILALK